MLARTWFRHLNHFSVLLLIVFFNQSFASEVFPAGHIVKNTEYHFEFVLSEAQWNSAEVGTYSDGSAEIEMAGYNNDASIIIFTHSDVSDISRLTQWRVGEAYDDFYRASCSESRKLMDNSILLSVLVICEGRANGESALAAHHYIQTDDEKFVEMFVQYRTSKVNMQSNRRDILNTLNSLRWLGELHPSDKE